MQIRLLTKRRADGEPYRRPAAVEDAIRATAELPRDQLLAQARVPEGHPGALALEVIAYWIREYAKGDRSVMNQLVEALLGRIRASLRRKTRASPSPEDALSEVHADLFGALLDAGRDDGDVYEVCFWTKLQATAVDVLRRQWVRQREIPTEPDAEPMTEIQSPLRPPDEEVDCQRENRQLLARLERLPNHLAKALLLEAAGWKIESSDPDEMTISRVLERTPRTIRNWLRDAREMLRADTGGER